MEVASSVHTLIELAALGIELLATALILCAIVAATAIYLTGLLRQVANPPAHYKQYKQRLGRALLLCLEILVAADIVRTIELDSSAQSVISLGLLVVIRTFLSWSLILEVEGRWPWQRERSEKRVDDAYVSVHPLRGVFRCRSACWLSSSVRSGCIRWLR